MDAVKASCEQIIIQYGHNNDVGIKAECHMTCLQQNVLMDGNLESCWLWVLVFYNDHVVFACYIALLYVSFLPDFKLHMSPIQISTSLIFIYCPHTIV